MDRCTATLKDRDVVIARGDDAVSYLQTQLTQDLESLEIGEPVWSFLLQAKGEIVAMLRATKTDASMVVLDTEPGLGAAILDRIDGHLFRTDVSFESATWPCVSLRGPGSESVDIDAVVTMRSPWPGEDGADFLGPDVTIPEGSEVISVSELESLRIRLGWPSMDDFDEKTTPAMTGIVGHTVSFVKGCYTGQEFVARVHYRDAAPSRRLVQVGFHPSGQPSVGEAIQLDGADVGELTSVSDHQPLALAYLKRSVESPVDAMMNGVPVCIGNLPSSTTERAPTEKRRTVSPLTLQP